MRKEELRTLRGQLLLIAGLFLFCIASGVYVAAQRANWFEPKLRETYTDPSRIGTAATKAAEKAAAGRLTAEDLAPLGPEQRKQVYELWVRQEAPPKTA